MDLPTPMIDISHKALPKSVFRHPAATTSRSTEPTAHIGPSMTARACWLSKALRRSQRPYVTVATTEVTIVLTVRACRHHLEAATAIVTIAGLWLTGRSA